MRQKAYFIIVLIKFLRFNSNNNFSIVGYYSKQCQEQFFRSQLFLVLYWICFQKLKSTFQAGKLRHLQPIFLGLAYCFIFFCVALNHFHENAAFSNFFFMNYFAFHTETNLKINLSALISCSMDFFYLLVIWIWWWSQYWK